MSGYSIRVAETIKKADGNLVGVQLGRICLERDLSVAEVARILGVSRQTVYGWFCGTKTPQPHHRHVIASWVEEFRRSSSPS